MYRNAEAEWKAIKLDFWVGDEQRGKGVEVLGRGTWARGGDEQMGPRGQHLVGAEKKGHPPAGCLAWITVLSLRNSGLLFLSSPAVTSQDR